MVEGNTIDEGGFFAAIYFYNCESLMIVFFMESIKFYLFSQKYIKISCPQDLLVLFLRDVVYFSLIFNPFCSVFVKFLKEKRLRNLIDKIIKNQN